MTPDLAVPFRAWQLPEADRTEPDEPSQERVMLLELAANLQNWPARNVVFTRALDRAAEDLVRMACELDSS